jgi:hypothetical protein
MNRQNFASTLAILLVLQVHLCFSSVKNFFFALLPDSNRRPQPRHPLRPSRRSLRPNRRAQSADPGRDPRSPRQFGLALHQPTFLQRLHRRRWRNRDRPSPRNSEFAADPNQRTCGLRQQRHHQMLERSRTNSQRNGKNG